MAQDGSEAKGTIVVVGVDMMEICGCWGGKGVRSSLSLRSRSKKTKKQDETSFGCCGSEFSKSSPVSKTLVSECLGKMLLCSASKKLGIGRE